MFIIKITNVKYLKVMKLVYFFKKNSIFLARIFLIFTYCSVTKRQSHYPHCDFLKGCVVSPKKTHKKNEKLINQNYQYMTYSILRFCGSDDGR